MLSVEGMPTCVCLYFPCVMFFFFLFYTEGGVWGNLLASDPADISGLCFAPFCVFLETWQPCVALPDPGDNSQYISVAVKCVFAGVCVCVCSPSMQIFVQFLSQNIWILSVFWGSWYIFVWMCGCLGYNYMVMDNDKKQRSLTMMMLIWRCFFLYDEWQIYQTRGRNQTAVFVGL